MSFQLGGHFILADQLIAVAEQARRFGQYIQFQLQPLIDFAGYATGLIKLLLGQNVLEIFYQGAIGHEQHRTNGRDGSQQNDQGEACSERK